MKIVDIGMIDKANDVPFTGQTFTESRIGGIRPTVIAWGEENQRKG